MSDHEGLELVGSARDADEAITLAAAGRPDVALLDVRMPGGGGPRASREILRANPETRVIAYTAYEERASAVQMIQAGATSYVLKGSRAAEIVEAIHLAAAGQGIFPPAVIPGVLGELASRIEVAARDESEHELRAARIRHELDSDAATVLFQPIIDLRSGDLVGLEALTRFASTPYRSPDVWFAEAAGVGLLEELELQAIRRAINAARTLPPDAYVALNLSPNTLVAERTRTLVDEAPARVVIEITEHAPIGNYDRLESALTRLRDHGGRLAVDDAGAGFASLRHILRLSPDIIKLDMSLTRDIHLDPRRRALAAAMITFAEELGATIVAEGVENQEELAALRQLGVPNGQGFFLGMPQSPGEILAKVGTRWIEPLARPAGAEAIRVSSPPAASDVAPSGVAPARATGPRASGFRDALTGLWHRQAFITLGRQTLAVAARGGGPVGLLSVDVSGTRLINEAFGRREGDRALRDVASLLVGTFRSSDVLARLGDDEFGVLMVGDASPYGGAPLGHLEQQLDHFNRSAGRPYQLALSIGTAASDARDRPVIEEMLAVAEAARREAAAARHSRPKLLVVEDDPSGQHLAQIVFADEFDVALASTGAEALDLAIARRPDVILLDLNLPDITGTRVAEVLRSSPRTSDIPILMVTGAEPSKELENLKAGVDDFVRKPYDVAVLRLRVENALRRSKR